MEKIEKTKTLKLNLLCLGQQRGRLPMDRAAIARSNAAQPNMPSCCAARGDGTGLSRARSSGAGRVGCKIGKFAKIVTFVIHKSDIE